MLAAFLRCLHLPGTAKMPGADPEGPTPGLAFGVKKHHHFGVYFSVTCTLRGSPKWLLPPVSLYDGIT